MGRRRGAASRHATDATGARRAFAHRPARDTTAREICRRVRVAELAPADRSLPERPRLIPPTHIIWPEAAPRSCWMARPDAQADIAELTGNSRVLLTGAGAHRGRRRQPQFYNSFAIFGPHGQLLAHLRQVSSRAVRRISSLASPILRRRSASPKSPRSTGFSSGPGPQTMTVPGAPPVGPLICYEVIFPGE